MTTMHTKTAASTPSDEVLNPIHIEVIKKSWHDSLLLSNKALGKAPKTPEAISKLHLLLDEDKKPLYSAHAIAKVLENSTGLSTRERVEPEASMGIFTPADEFVTIRRLAQQDDAQQADPTPEPFIIDCPALAAVTGDGHICPEFSWPEIAESIQAVSDLMNAKMALFYAPPQQTEFRVILSESLFRRTDRSGTYELRPTVPTPTKARHQLPSPEGVRQVGQRLSFDSFHTVQTYASTSQAQLKYEREVRKALISELEKRFPSEIPCRPLETMLDSIHHIQRVWMTFLRDEDNAVDGVDGRKKRMWFIEICLTRLDGAAKTKWRQLRSDQQDAGSYETLEDFLRQLFEAAVPKNALKKPSDLIEDLSKTISKTSLDSWESLLALVAVQVQRAEVLGTFAPGAEPAVLANAELKFWATILTPRAKDELATMLHFQRLSSRSPSQTGKGVSRATRFDLYPLEEVRAALYARADRETLWELDILWPGGSAGKQQARPPPRSAAAEPPSSDKPEQPPAALSFISSMDGSRVTFPVRHLKDEPSYALRQKYEAEYLKHQVFPKAFCKNSNCKLSGHTFFVCPRLSKCGADGVEQNPRSFFKGLHLPKLLQALPKGDGGKHTEAPVMLVAPSAPSLSAINFQEAFTSPEFQTALQTAIQASRQQSGDLGNGRAGAGF